MEIVEQFTLEGSPTGKPISRNEAHREGTPHQTAHVWIINSQKEILLQKRAACKESHPNLWDVSSAGHIPFGESVVDSAIRECEEEIGIVAHPEELQAIGRVYQEYFNEKNHFFDREWVELFLLRRDLPATDFTVQIEEVSEVRWFSLETFFQMVQSKYPELVDHTLEYQHLINLLQSL